MSSVRELHDKAMGYAQRAQFAEQMGDETEQLALIQQAMEWETQAANLVPDLPTSEPTRAILYRSAASFAYQAEAYDEAERLIFKGLAGYPPTNIKHQLLDLLNTVNKHRSSHEDLSYIFQLQVV